MFKIDRRRLFIGATLMAAATLLPFNPASAELKGLEIMAPAAPCGGGDLTARAVQAALRDSGAATSTQVVNIAGAGGTIGLAQFVSTKKGKGNALMVTGMIMQGAILTNKSPMTLQSVTPIARLVGEYEMLAVTSDSPIKTLADLIEKLKADPRSVSWAGGSVGGTDQILAGLIGQKVGIDPKQINYIAHSGGGEAMQSLLGGHTTVGVNGYAELAPQVAAGKLRALAISSDERLPGIDVPTLKEQGVDISLANWRGIVAAPDIKESDRKALSAAIAQMVESPAWKKTIATQEWTDMYQPADEFGAFLKKDKEQVEGVLKDIGLVQ
jgi:putative tricarboxylic transport membrane protein